MEYQWKRFWCPREGRYDLSDEGFLSDPDGEYSKFVQTDVLSSDRIAEIPCVALLGEPGIGKSTALRDLKQELMQLHMISEAKLICLNLNEYGSEERLIKDIFECGKFQKWENSNEKDYLLLDSLDECRIQIPHVANILKARFNDNKSQINRLYLRICCRTADWPIIFEDSLPELWGKENYGAFEWFHLKKRC